MISIPHAVMLVPRRADGGRRDELWNFCREWWKRSLDIPIVEGHHNDGPFNRSAAINSAAREGDDRRLVNAHQMAVREALDTNRPILPFTDRVELTRFQTGLLIDTGQASRSIAPIKNTVSGIIIVPRTVWYFTRGFDEDYVGWGPEDLDFF